VKQSLLLSALIAAAAIGATERARADCPIGTEIEVDYDLPGSGYSEESDNWTTWNTAPCAGSGYRYLSHTVGDGSRRGKAFFEPAITHDGYWQFLTGYRATGNRTNDADYWAYDDLGGAVHQSVDQTQGEDCEWVDLGTFYCQVGGNCRVVLDGTDDGKSDCADVTIFRLVSCDDPGDAGAPDGGPAGRCDGIRAVPAYEVCEETATTCAGVFTDGSGCAAYCAAADMTCTARYGGEPNCQKEPQNPIDCGANNGHQSDWCECEGPPLEPDAGVGGSGASGTGGTAGTGGNGSVAGNGSGAGTTAAGGAAGSGAAAMDGADPGSLHGSCGCRAIGRSRAADNALLAGLFALLVLWRKRRGQAR